MKQEIVFNFSSPESSNGFLLYKLYALWENGIKKVLKNYNITHPQFVTLTTTAWFLTYMNSPTQKALSEKTGIDVMTTSVIIQGLLKKGFINRISDKEDSRAYKIYLTETGKKVVQETMNAVDMYDIEFFSILNDQKGALASSMQQLINTHK